MDYSVAIVIPTLNEERFISRCLDSVIAQTFPFAKIEVLIIDGGSKDKTCAIVKEYMAKYPNIRLIDNPKRIQAAAFNMGVANSSAPYIVRLDAHAVYHECYVEGCVSCLEENSQRGNVGGRWNICPQNQSTWAVANALLNSSRFGIGGAIYRMGAQAGNVDTVPFGAFPRRVVEEIGGMREDLPRGEDNEYNSRIKKAGYDIYFNPAIVCDYYARPTLASSCRQMFANGVSIGHLFYIDKDSIGLRHLIPLFFVQGIMLGILASIVFRPVLCALVAGAAVYFLCDLIASMIAGSRYGWRYSLPLFFLFFCVHVSYGAGTMVGLIVGRN